MDQHIGIRKYGLGHAAFVVVNRCRRVAQGVNRRCPFTPGVVSVLNRRGDSGSAPIWIGSRYFGKPSATVVFKLGDAVIAAINECQSADVVVAVVSSQTHWLPRRQHRAEFAKQAAPDCCKRNWSRIRVHRSG